MMSAPSDARQGAMTDEWLRLLWEEVVGNKGGILTSDVRRLIIEVRHLREAAHEGVDDLAMIIAQFFGENDSPVDAAKAVLAAGYRKRP
jgi:hypothetical protein